MNNLLMTTMVLSLFAFVATARIGENYTQCVTRYGEPIRKIGGYGQFWGLAVFEKDDIMVVTAFDKTTKKCTAVIYSRGDFRLAKRYPENEADSMTLEEISSLLSTVPGKWEKIDISTQQSIGVSTSKSRNTIDRGTASEVAKAHTQARAQEIQTSVEKFMKSFGLEPGTTNSPVYHATMSRSVDESNGRFSWNNCKLIPCYSLNFNMFACYLMVEEVRRGLVIVNYAAKAALIEWSVLYRQEITKMTNEQKGKSALQGF